LSFARSFSASASSRALKHGLDGIQYGSNLGYACVVALVIAYRVFNLRLNRIFDRFLARLWFAPIIALGIAGCASKTDWSKEPLPVSISAANYSQVTGEELYRRVNGPANTQPTPPTPPEPAKPLFYAFVPGEIYASDVPLETVYRELATPLANRGYFNIVYEMKAGLLPNRIDYLLRIHCGERYWLIPTVRSDKVTWGDDGLVSSWSGSHPMKSASLIGPNSRWDGRVGESPSEIGNLALYFQQSELTSQGGRNSVSELQGAAFQDFSADAGSRDYCLVMVEAFRFEDVRTMKNKAPCVWATFIAVPLHQGQEFSSVLRTMVRTATPYFGTTADGLQIYEVPPGKVLIGNPIEVPGSQKPPQPAGPETRP